VNTSLTVQGNLTLGAGGISLAAQPATHIGLNTGVLRLQSPVGIQLVVNAAVSPNYNTFLDQYGRLGIGTSSPDALLHVGWGTLGNTTGSGIGFAYDNAGGKIQSYGRPLLLNPLNQSVGIGTISPTQALDVGGRINASQGVNVNGVEAIDSAATAKKSYYAP